MARSNPDDPDGIPFLVLGNKLDLELEGPRQVTTEQGRDYCHRNKNILFYETSAKDSVNVDEAFN